MKIRIGPYLCELDKGTNSFDPSKVWPQGSALLTLPLPSSSLEIKEENPLLNSLPAATVRSFDSSTCCVRFFEEKEKKKNKNNNQQGDEYENSSRSSDDDDEEPPQSPPPIQLQVLSNATSSSKVNSTEVPMVLREVAILGKGERNPMQLLPLQLRQSSSQELVESMKGVIETASTSVRCSLQTLHVAELINSEAQRFQKQQQELFSKEEEEQEQQNENDDASEDSHNDDDDDDDGEIDAGEQKKKNKKQHLLMMMKRRRQGTKKKKKKNDYVRPDGGAVTIKRKWNSNGSKFSIDFSRRFLVEHDNNSNDDEGKISFSDELRMSEFSSLATLLLDPEKIYTSSSTSSDKTDLTRAKKSLLVAQRRNREN